MCCADFNCVITQIETQREGERERLSCICNFRSHNNDSKQQYIKFVGNTVHGNIIRYSVASVNLIFTALDFVRPRSGLKKGPDKEQSRLIRNANAY